MAALLSLALLAPVMAAASSPASDATLTIRGGGWGHGVGMSQFGAHGRAQAGHTASEILAFYYHGSTVASVPTSHVEVQLTNEGSSRSAATVTVSSGSPTVVIGDRQLTDLPSSVTIALGPEIGGLQNWSVSHPGEDPLTIVELCPAEAPCVGPTVSIIRPADATITIDGEGTHAAGNIRFDRSGPGFVVRLANLPIEDYVRGIQEVPAWFHPAALQAQAIAARSFAVASFAGRGFLYDSTRDQVYNGTAAHNQAWLNAVAATSGQVVAHNGSTIQAFYSSSNGGFTAASEDSFVTPLPYLVAKPDPFDAALDANGEAQNPNATWVRTYTVDRLGDWFASSGLIGDVGDVLQILLSDVPPSGRINNASARIVGSDRTVDVSGFDLYNAINARAPACGGNDTVDCGSLRSTNLRLASFGDVPFGAYFTEPVEWMAEHGITTGTGPNTFSPKDTNTRGGLATFIHRFADEPSDVALPGPFTDVREGSWYELAVAWLADAAITTGITPDEFAPDGTVSRAQAATFLWRFAGSPGADAEVVFTDVSARAYYADAVRWMVEWGITTGTTPTTFSPNDAVTRAQIATFLWRLAGTPDAFTEGVELPDAMRDS